MEPRPLSPHLRIYRWQLTWVMSIMHRFTGVALVGFIMGLVAWLFSINQGPQCYQIFTDFLSTWPMKVMLLFLVISLNYHFFNGIRHLCWDRGLGLELKDVYRSGWLVLALTLVSSFIIWELL